MKQSSKLKKFVIILTFIINTVASGYLIYALSLLDGIENKLRLMIAATLGVVWLIFLICYRRSLKKTRSKYGLFIPITIIYASALCLGGFYIIKTYNIIGNMTTKGTVYSSSIITLKKNKVTKVSQIKKSDKIGMLGDESSIDGYTIPKEIIKEKNLKNEIEEYESYIALLKGLYDKEIKYAILPTNYPVMFQNVEEAELSNLKGDTKIIYTKEKKDPKKTASKKTSSLNEPFTILLMGVDSENENLANSSFNGDSLILITFNPKTLSTTMLSIPRDSYVPIMCFAGKRKNKITHAAWHGQDCMIKTIENFTGIDIDYYVKINFKGVVKLVDKLGGVEVDVPYNFCESNSNREFGDNTVFVKKGKQILNGEKALAFSRNRHTWTQYCGPEYSNYNSNDFVRGQNQQKVIRAILNKLKNVHNINTVYDLLDTISNSMETNLETNQILSLYNIGKDILVKSSGGDVDELLGIQRLYLNGSGAMIYEPGSGLELYNYILSQTSLDAVVDAMKVNLGKKKAKMIKKFSFRIDEPYEETVIGKNLYGNLQSYTKTKKPDDSDKKCGTNEELGADQKTCVCKNGYKKVNGKCTKKDGKEEKPAPTEYNNQCVPEGDGYYWYDSNGKRNPTKYIDSTCSKTETTPSCGENEEPNGAGGCKCKTGYEKNASGVCVSTPPTEPDPPQDPTLP